MFLLWMLLVIVVVKLKAWTVIGLPSIRFDRSAFYYIILGLLISILANKIASCQFSIVICGGSKKPERY